MNDEPPRQSLVEFFAELGELTKDTDWDAIIAEREAERRMPEDLAQLVAALARLVAAKDEKEAHGDTPRYRELKIGAWEMARAALARHPVPDLSPEDRPR